MLKKVVVVVVVVAMPAGCSASTEPLILPPLGPVEVSSLECPH